MEQEEYEPSVKTAGFKVILHQPEDPIVMEEFGFGVSPGRLTYVTVEKEKVRFSSCRSFSALLALFLPLAPFVSLFSRAARES